MSNIPKPVLYTVIAALVLTAAFLIFYSLKQIVLQSQQDPNFQGTEGDTTPSSGTNSQGTETEQKSNDTTPSSGTNSQGTETEQKLLRTIPSSTSSLEVKTAFSKEVAKYAKSASSLEITRNTPNPLILKVSANSSFTIRNNDDVTYKINIGNASITLAPTATGNIVSGDENGKYLTTYLIFINGINRGFISVE